jgi:DNA-binding NarL/FixJ family response regulator
VFPNMAGVFFLRWLFNAQRNCQLHCESTVSELTRREAEVAGLVSQGLANKAVAGQLGIAESMVKIHLHTSTENYAF